MTYYDVRFVREWLCAVLAAGCAFWLSVLQWAPLFKVFVDDLRVSAVVCTVFFLAAYFCIVYVADRNPYYDSRPEGKNHSCA